MYKNDASGKLVGRTPGKSIELVRNPNWDAKTDYRPAYLDSITVEEGNDDSVSSSRRVLKGQGLVQGDGTTPAPVIKQALSEQKDQIAFIPGGGYRFVSMNSTIKPFDNLNVRKAVVAASDRKALQLTRGGTAAGDLATHFLPVDFPGFEDAGGAKGPSLDFMANPSGDMAVAKKYMLAAKKEDPSLPIDADGKWTDSNQLLMVAVQRRPGKKTAEVAQAQFEKLGFKIRFRAVPQDTLYTKFCNVPVAEDRHLPERRLVQGLQRPAGGAGRRVQRQEHHPRQQLQLDAAQRPRHQRRDGEGRAAARRPRAQQGVGPDRRHGHRAGAGHPVPVGQDPHGRVV